MTEPSESILRRVRALLDIAEHERTGEHERDAAMAKATDLMAAYGIQRTMLAASSLTVDDPIDQTVIAMTDPYSYEKATLLVRITNALRCETLIYKQGRRATRVAIVGAASDRERVNMLYTSLLIQALRGMLREVSPYRDAGETKARRAAYLVGFACQVGERLRVAETRAARDYDEQRPAGTPGTELVLADRTALVKQAFTELFPSTTRLPSRSYNSQAYGRGEEGGRSADIGTTRVNGDATRQLGAVR